MYLHQSEYGLVVHTPAKLNLFFEVLAKRADGYHEIESLVYPIDLYDTLVFREDFSGQVALGCVREFGFRGQYPHDEVPRGPDNLAVRAMDLVRRRTGVRCGASVWLLKRIPSSAGLGGGSSDAAAALTAANRLWNLGISHTELSQWGAELGSDVPLFLAQGPVVCRGRGEQIDPVEGLGALHFVVVRPPAGLSTAAVYATCRVPNIPFQVQPIRESLLRGELSEVGRRMFNRLQPAAETLSPWIRRLRKAFEKMDLLGHQISGSGSCYFGLCRHARHARRVARRLHAVGIGTAVAVRGSR